jgi:hypothetical protein
MWLGEVVEAALFPWRVRYLGDGVVHPVRVVDPGQIGLVEPFSQHLPEKKGLYTVPVPDL